MNTIDQCQKEKLIYIRYPRHKMKENFKVVVFIKRKNLQLI